ncbi:MAG: histidine phosphatase family protein [Actinomycetota bacterium]
MVASADDQQGPGGPGAATAGSDGPGQDAAGRPETMAATYGQHFYEPPTGSAQVLLIRHGQSEPYTPGNPFPLVDGHGDPKLTELGHYQARLVGERLGDEPVEAIYVSSLTRTHQTAAPLAERLGLTPTVEPDLREVFLGDWEGGLMREMMAREHPAAMALRNSGEWGDIPGAETNRQLTDRTVGAVRAIAGRHADGGLVAAFCHGGVIAAVVGYAIGIGATGLTGARHTSISHLVIEQPADDPAHWTVRLFNDGAHAGTLTGDHQPPG